MRAHLALDVRRVVSVPAVLEVPNLPRPVKQNGQIFDHIRPIGHACPTPARNRAHRKTDRPTDRVVKMVKRDQPIRGPIWSHDRAVKSMGDERTVPVVPKTSRTRSPAVSTPPDLP